MSEAERIARLEEGALEMRRRTDRIENQLSWLNRFAFSSMALIIASIILQVVK